MNKNEKMPPSRPGEEGMSAVFICPVCGKKFVRTSKEQQYCSVACKKKAKNKTDQ